MINSNINLIIYSSTCYSAELKRRHFLCSYKEWSLKLHKIGQYNSWTGKTDFIDSCGKKFIFDPVCECAW